MGPALGSRVGNGSPSLLAQMFDQPLGLRGGPRAVDAFQDDQFAAGQGLSPWRSSTTNPRACRARVILYSCLVSSPRKQQPTRHALAKFRACVALALLFALPACKRSVQVSSARPADVTTASPRGVLCVEQPDACLYCVGREGEAPFLEAFQSRPRVCDPKDAEECVEFCSALAPACALPWTPGAHCVLDSELDFHRALFNRDTADRPEVIFSGRVTDEGGHRLEGVHVEIRVTRGTQFTPLGDEVSAKDGTFKLHLRNGPWTYALRLRRNGLASEIVDRLAPDSLALPALAPHGTSAWAQSRAPAAGWSTPKPAPRWQARCCKRCAHRKTPLR